MMSSVPLRIHNTLSGKIELFVPQNPSQVTMYVCGVTVYDYCHVGHARAYVNFDCIRRCLTHWGYTVYYVQNFTDIDDKIIVRAQERDLPISTITDTYIQAFFEDMDLLNIQRATAYPRATDYIPQMLTMIQGLLDKNAAYVINGDVWCRVEYASDYGKLSKKVLADLIAGKRVETVTDKENPFDFALWKSAKPGEPAWDSPWGLGRPGWHIECSAMALDQLGKTVDIHGGGEDLVFPHHENEICQSEIFNEQPLANYWVHNGFVTIKDEKMSKSKSNFFTIRDILKSFSGEVLRFFLLKVHYRSPLNFSFEGLKEAEQALKKLSGALTQFPPTHTPIQEPVLLALIAKFEEALAEDFNFAQAIGVLFEIYHTLHLHQWSSDSLLYCGKILGLWMTSQDNQPPQFILDLGAQRRLAKASKLFAEADAIRTQILEQGWIIEDTADGIRWKKA